MAYDEGLAARVRSVFKSRKGVAEKKMFGGLAFMVNGAMTCGIVRDTLMLRLGDEGTTKALKHKHVRPMDFTGKPMKSMVYVDCAGLNTDAALRAWVERAVEYTMSLPVKTKKRRHSQ